MKYRFLYESLRRDFELRLNKFLRIWDVVKFVFNNFEITYINSIIAYVLLEALLPFHIRLFPELKTRLKKVGVIILTEPYI